MKIVLGEVRCYKAKTVFVEKLKSQHFSLRLPRLPLRTDNPGLLGLGIPGATYGASMAFTENGEPWTMDLITYSTIKNPSRRHDCLGTLYIYGEGPITRILLMKSI